MGRIKVSGMNAVVDRSAAIDPIICAPPLKACQAVQGPEVDGVPSLSVVRRLPVGRKPVPGTEDNMVMVIVHIGGNPCPDPRRRGARKHAWPWSQRNLGSACSTHMLHATVRVQCESP